MAYVDIGKVRGLVEPILTELGMELVEARFLSEQGRPTLRILIDREGGVSVGDCERVSREIETLLQVEEAIPASYNLEVSSPGLDRPLVKESDFVRYAGQKASIRTREAMEGRRNYKGLLKGVEAGEVVVEVDGQDYRIPVGLIEKAHLVY